MPRLVFSKNKSQGLFLYRSIKEYTKQHVTKHKPPRVEANFMHGAVVTFLQRKPVITVDSNSRHCTKLYTPEKHTGPNNKSCGSLSIGQAMQRAGSRISSCCSSEHTEETHGGSSELCFEKEPSVLPRAVSLTSTC